MLKVFAKRFMIVLGISAATFTANAQPASYEDLAMRLLAYQTSEGAILLNQTASGSSARLVPYFSNLAALGWTESAAATTDTAARKRYLDATAKWLRWFAAHQNPNGTIYDFEGDPAALKPTGTYDSTDSYAATFALLLWRYYEASQDAALVRELQKPVEGAHAAVELTMDDDGLTYAHPFYPVKYLMDNCEVAAGLAAFQRIYNLLGDQAAAKRAADQLELVKSQLHRYFEPKQQVFRYALDAFGSATGGFTTPYPDAMANLMALAWASNGDEGARVLLDKLKTEFWNKNAESRGFPQWWVWAAAVCEDRELLTAARAAQAASVAKPNPYCHDLGMACATAASGARSIRFSEFAMPWEKLAGTGAQVASRKPDSFPPAGTHIVLTGHKATGWAKEPGNWKLRPVTLPLRVGYTLKEKASYLQANIVFDGPQDLSAAKAFQLQVEGAGQGSIGIQLALIESDGDWWDAPLPSTAGGAIDPAKLTINPWGKNGDGKVDLSRILGWRVQITNASGTAENSGEILIQSMSMNSNGGTR